MTDLPDDLYAFLKSAVDHNHGDPVIAAGLLAKYPRSQPEPAWEPGDVVLTDSAEIWKRGESEWSTLDRDGIASDGYIAALSPDLIARAGRRVYPPQFADHAGALRFIAAHRAVFDKDAATLRRIAADLAGDNND